MTVTSAPIVRRPKPGTRVRPDAGSPGVRQLRDQLGLEILTESEAAIVFQCGGGTHLDITRSATGTADEQPQAAWQVTDIRAEVADLRSRGVMVQDYDIPGLTTEGGIADIGFAWAAWVIDPGKNALASCNSSNEHRAADDRSHSLGADRSQLDVLEFRSNNATHRPVLDALAAAKGLRVSGTVTQTAFLGIVAPCTAPVTP